MTNPRLNQLMLGLAGAIFVSLAGFGLTITFLDVIWLTWTSLMDGETPDWRELRAIVIDVSATAALSLLGGTALDRFLRQRKPHNARDPIASL